MPLIRPQNTRLEILLTSLNGQLLGGWRGPWRRRSLLLLTLLFGMYLGNNLTSLWLARFASRPAVVLMLVVGLEIIVRVRSRWVRDPAPLAWSLCDNLRIGLVYAVIFEAFKVGS
ncbi:MAG: DUF565 domain-containing protein [Cyanobacteriota bacterium]